MKRKYATSDRSGWRLRKQSVIGCRVLMFNLIYCAILSIVLSVYTIYEYTQNSVHIEGMDGLIFFALRVFCVPIAFASSAVLFLKKEPMEKIAGLIVTTISVLWAVAVSFAFGFIVIIAIAMFYAAIVAYFPKILLNLGEEEYGGIVGWVIFFFIVEFLLFCINVIRKFEVIERHLSIVMASLGPAAGMMRKITVGFVILGLIAAYGMIFLILVGIAYAFMTAPIKIMEGNLWLIAIAFIIANAPLIIIHYIIIKTVKDKCIKMMETTKGKRMWELRWHQEDRFK
jgi:hypothetical protein